MHADVRSQSGFWQQTQTNCSIILSRDLPPPPNLQLLPCVPTKEELWWKTGRHFEGILGLFRVVCLPLQSVSFGKFPEEHSYTCIRARVICVTSATKCSRTLEILWTIQCAKFNTTCCKLALKCPTLIKSEHLVLLEAWSELCVDKNCFGMLLWKQNFRALVTQEISKGQRRKLLRSYRAAFPAWQFTGSSTRTCNQWKSVRSVLLHSSWINKNNCHFWSNVCTIPGGIVQHTSIRVRKDRTEFSLVRPLTSTSSQKDYVESQHCSVETCIMVASVQSSIVPCECAEANMVRIWVVGHCNRSWQEMCASAWPLWTHLETRRFDREVSRLYEDSGISLSGIDAIRFTFSRPENPRAPSFLGCSLGWKCCSIYTLGYRELSNSRILGCKSNSIIVSNKPSLVPFHVDGAHELS